MRGFRVSGMLAVLALVLVTAAAPAVAPARPYLPPPGKVFAGLTGGTRVGPYQRMVGKHPPVFEIFMRWNTPTGWLAAPNRGLRTRLALHIGTASGYGGAGVISPEAIALGRSDRFLVALGRNLAHQGRITYIRLMAEMNGYWNAYAAFNGDGSSRGVGNSPYFYTQAWRRSVLILRGGRVGVIDRRLRSLGLPPVWERLSPRARLARPKVAFLWVPQDAGSPDILGNSPAAFWPGGAYVDWVGTDFYASYPNFALLDGYMSMFPGKPFVLSEWALYGADDPRFVAQLFAWARAHPRVRMLNYYQGFTAGALPNLGHYPRSRRVLRARLRAARFPAYAPEYAHPRRHHRHHKPPPERPPLPPGPAQPPTPVRPPPGPGPPRLCLPLLTCLPL
ncbi:MAG: hypothetical protein M3Z27_02335 [Actinomycetota bacterium]|nr:hypothetical protein [Actinomycetota bacterium]